MRSNTVMDNNDPTLERLTDLEIKASYMEDTLDRLNDVVVRQQQQIDLLRREITRLLRQGQPLADTPGPRDELPPHY